MIDDEGAPVRFGQHRTPAGPQDPRRFRDHGSRVGHVLQHAIGVDSVDRASWHVDGRNV